MKQTKKRIYLDHAAATYVEPEVEREMRPYSSQIFGNPSSLHTPGREARAAIEAARKKVADIVNATAEEIIFTGSGSESDNLAVFGVAGAYAHAGKHIIVSKIEHKAILEAAKRLEKRGFEVTYLNVDAMGMVKLDELARALRPDTILVSIMYANNEIGTIEPIADISAIISEFRKNKNSTQRQERQGKQDMDSSSVSLAASTRPTPSTHLTPSMATPIFHTDACQAAGALSLDVQTLGVDLLTLNGSKIYGPKGIGCLFKRKDIRLEPQIVGGEHEMNLRAGSENVAAMVGFAHALELADRIRVKEGKRLSTLRDYAAKKLIDAIPESRLNGHPSKRLPNNINISMFGIEGEAILLMLDELGVAASTGSACAAQDLVPSHVLLALGLSPEYAHGSIRLTLGRTTTKKDMEYVAKILPEIASRLRAISSSWSPSLSSSLSHQKVSTPTQKTT